MNNTDFGVCRLAIVPVRKDADDRSEQSSQLLFGDHYEVLSHSKDGKWTYIRIFHDAYQGWIDFRQHHSITKEYFDQINHADFKITTDLTCGILYKKHPLTIVMGSIVPISNSELFKMEEQFAFNGESKSLGLKRDFEFLRSIALKYMNAPYQWGGKSPFGIDCSGFVQMVFKIAGYYLPRDTSEQVVSGEHVEGVSAAAPGDLVFFGKGDGTTSHVGLLLDGDRIIHSSGNVRIDGIMEEGIVNADTKVISHFTTAVRRILPEQVR